MKELIVIAAVTLFLVGLFASCNNKLCPAYSKTDTEQTDSNG